MKNFIKKITAPLFFSSDSDPIPERFRELKTFSQYHVLACAVVFLLSGYYILSFFSATHDKKNDFANALVVVEKNPILYTQNPFDHLELEAQAAYVLDVKSGKTLFSKNENMELPLASLTKIMTAQKASEILPPDAIVRISEDALKREGDSGLFLNEEWRLRDLIDFTLIVSSNDGAYALASEANAIIAPSKSADSGLEDFIQSMNAEALKLGLLKTHFENETGLDENTENASGFGSARDMAVLFSFILKKNPNLLEGTKYSFLEIRSLSNKTHAAKNTNASVDKIPNVLASKTGFTDIAGGNVIVSFDTGIDHPVIIVVLGSTGQGRFADMEKLAHATLEYIEN